MKEAASARQTWMPAIIRSACFLSFSLCAFPSVLPTLTTANSAHSLSTQEARRQYPVHFRGIVTCVDPTSGLGQAAAFVHDSSGTIYVRYRDDQAPSISAGATVDVVGVSGPGSAAPIVDNASVKVFGYSAKPENPPLQDLFHLETGAQDDKWVEVEGTVRSTAVISRRDATHKYVTLQLAMVGGSIGVSMLWEPAVDYTALIDAKVRIRGNAAALFNRNDQIVGARLLASGRSAIRIVEAAPGDPFLTATTPVNDLLRWNMVSTSRHRVHVRGKVTLQWPGTSLCIADETRGICSQSAQDTSLSTGDLVDVIGFAEAQNGTMVLADAQFKKAGHARPVVAASAAADEVMLGKFDSELVRIDGHLIGRDLTSSDVNLVLTSGNLIFNAVLPKSLAGDAPGSWEIGSKLRITGICSIRLDVESSAVGKGVAVAKSFRVLMRSTQDVDVLARPPWWTAGHAAVLLAILFLIVVAAIGWIARLRQRVQKQRDALRKAHEETTAINELSLAMEQVTAQRMLSARVSASGSEQIARLGIGFNRMISELEEGDMAKKAAEAKLLRQALTDELTGLPNRRAFSERLTESLDAAQHNQRIVAVLFIDLDGFKAINDTQGHAAGDLLLVEVALRLKSQIRESDMLARLGGDEFTILLTTLSRDEEAEQLGLRVLEVLRSPVRIADQAVSIGASIGISLFPTSGADAAALLREADSAMYAAKDAGKNQVRCFTEEMGRSTQERMSLEIELRNAVARGEIHIEYQPEFDLQTHRLTRFEALARWTHPVLGSISPAKFIPVAEESGQIVELGAFVLAEACKEAVKWQALSSRPIQVAVNVSSVQFSRDSFVDEVAQALKNTRLMPELLQIELTESIMLTGAEQAAETMKRLRSLGVSLAIDDFGTGYSGLSYLPRLPFEMMKIDRSFVRNLSSGGNGAKSILSFLIALAHGLNMQVIVEGVETLEQMEIVRQLNGNEIQGFLTGCPMTNPQSLVDRTANSMELNVMEDRLAVLV